MSQTATRQRQVLGTEETRLLKAVNTSPAQGLHALGQFLDFTFHPRSVFLSPDHPTSVTGILAAVEAAIQAIEIKATQIAGLAGNSLGDVEAVAGGYMGRYEGCDIYFSKATGAHEVHGEIKAKYDVLLGPAGKLGLPTTDETGVADGIGRFNNFENGSIFWTGHTGPFSMMSAIRDFWLANGAQSILGYPVYDQYQQVPSSPDIDPHIAWSSFENGAIVQTPDGVLQARNVEISPAGMRQLIRTTVDAQVHATGDNIGLHPNVETTAVGTWGHGFWASIPRDITFALHGFHDNGLLPDTNFTLVIGLRFELIWPMGFSEPAQKTLIASLDFLRVLHESGLDDFIPIVPGKVVSGVASGVYNAFFPDPPTPGIPVGSIVVTTVPTLGQAVPNAIDVVGVLTTADGGLQVLLNPLPVGPPIDIGEARQNFAQTVIDKLVNG